MQSMSNQFQIAGLFVIFVITLALDVSARMLPDMRVAEDVALRDLPVLAGRSGRDRLEDDTAVVAQAELRRAVADDGALVRACASGRAGPGTGSRGVA